MNVLGTLAVVGLVGLSIWTYGGSLAAIPYAVGALRRGVSFVAESGKKKLFRTMFEERLLPQGFFWKDRGFYRIGDEVLIGVSLYVGPAGAYYSLKWFCFPFCWKLGIEQIKAYGDEQIEPFLALDPSTDFKHFLDKSFEEQLSIMHRVFFRDVFDHFNIVRNVEECLNYQNWRLNIYEGGPQKEYLEIPKAWECINLHKYEDAISYLRRYLDKAKDFPANPSSRLRDAVEESTYLLKLIEKQDFIELDRMLQERIFASKAACREYFG